MLTRRLVIITVLGFGHIIRPDIRYPARKSRSGPTLAHTVSRAEQDQIFNLSVSIWALQVTPKVRSGKITTRASIFKIEILNA